MQIAIFGGSFNPLHVGHVAVVQHLLHHGLDQVIIIPTSRSPFKRSCEMIPNSVRWQMVNAAFANNPNVVLSDHELKQPKICYTADTLKALLPTAPTAQWWLTLGADTFASFHQWKRAQWILEKASLLVVQRSGRLLNGQKCWQQAEIPAYLRQWEPNCHWDDTRLKIMLNNRCLVEFLPLDTPDISATEIRDQSISLESIPVAAQSIYQDYLKQLSNSTLLD